MKNYSVTRRLVLALLLLTAAVAAISGHKSLTAQVAATGDIRTLSFEERVSHQRAIEEVYWRHKLWPQENGRQKPALDEVMPDQAIREKVADTLRKSKALEIYWQRPVTAEQLQAEMTRMASQSQQPELLRELWAALGNDPFVIAECLARPALVERLARDWYASDTRFHADLRARVEAELVNTQTAGELGRLSGQYNEVEWAHEDAASASKSGVVAAQKSSRATDKFSRLSAGQWDEQVERLSRALGSAEAESLDPMAGKAVQDGAAKGAGTESLPLKRVSSLQESAHDFSVTMVLEKSSARLKLANVRWAKEPFELWWQNVKGGLEAESEMAFDGGYELPQMGAAASASGADNTWKTLATALEARSSHNAVWTGTEMLVWGGTPSTTPDGSYNPVGRYNPATDTWTLSSNAGAPRFLNLGRGTAVWTGTEMIVYNSSMETNKALAARYNPTSDLWTPVNMTNAPSIRVWHTAVWTGSRMIVWGGRSTYHQDTATLNTGGVYDPATDTWTKVSTTNAPVARNYHTAVWTGAEMLVWGGWTGSGSVNTGGRYNPVTNTWTAMQTGGAPAARFGHEAVWTGSELIVWGGADAYYSSNKHVTGGRYNPATDSWTPTSTNGVPVGRDAAVSVWTGTEMLIWGGFDGDNRITTGARYNPSTDSWTWMSETNKPRGGALAAAVWTGSEMIVWGGQDVTAAVTNTGGRYNPATDSWVAANNPPNGGIRQEHPAVWTGTEMIIWGSYTSFMTPTDTGARYSPATDTWTPTSLVNVPKYRYAPTAVWTGTEMVVWGGCSDSFCFNRLNTGGRYNPMTDSWRPTTTTGAPEARYWFSAVWTGAEMIVWGGCNYQTCGPGGNADPYGLNNGGRYNPVTDTWQLTGTTNAPVGRWGQTAVWTGTEMIVWGGINGYTVGALNTGGRYNPATNNWQPTTLTNAPTGNSNRTSVWTGSEFIVWGGDIETQAVSGGRYNPLTDSWTHVSNTNAPRARSGFTSIWTGSEMVIWGGCTDYNCQTPLNTGARYKPQTDTWVATSTVNAPTARDAHSAVWTGSEMIVFGGEWGARNPREFHTGGRYFVNAPNSLPSVNLTSPALGTIYGLRSNVVMTAEAFDSDGSISRVDFLVNGMLVGSSTSAPYTATWSNTPPGRYVITARATDNMGAVSESLSVNIRVDVRRRLP